jgi:hypothetical protein
MKPDTVVAVVAVGFEDEQGRVGMTRLRFSLVAAGFIEPMTRH